MPYTAPDLRSLTGTAGRLGWWLGAAALSALLTAIAGGLFYFRPPPEQYFDSHVSPWQVMPIEPGQTRVSPIALIGDCLPGHAPPECGSPPALWHISGAIPLCVVDSRTPSWLTQTEFREHLDEAAAIWNQNEARIGIDFVGSCPRDAETAGTLDQQNMVSWRDTPRPAIGVVATTSVFIEPFNRANGRRDIPEADIDLVLRDAVAGRCVVTILLHEIGHLIGLGHSSNRADLMYPTFAPSAPSTCKQAPSTAEHARVRELYGGDAAPSVHAPTMVDTPADSPVDVLAKASDPDGEILRYAWRQVAGPPIHGTLDTSTLSFMAPSGAGILTFVVEVSDPYMHTATQTVSVVVRGGIP